MKRRAFIASAAAAGIWPGAGRAQQSQPHVIGVLHSVDAGAPVPGVRRGLADAGLVEGRDFTFERRSAEGHPERLAALADDLVRRRVAVIVAGGGPAPATAAQKATTTVPIVFFSGGDPVDRHLVTSLARPGGNVTGITSIGVALEAKRVALLHQLLPPQAPIGGLIDTAFAEAAVQERELQTAAASVGRPLHLARTAGTGDIDGAVAQLAAAGARGFVAVQSPFYTNHRQPLVEAAALHALPAVFHRREFVDDGGLASYGADFDDGYRQVGVYVARILAGVSPGDLPVAQPTKFEMVLNARTAKTLGLTIPPSLLTTADEVIE